MQRGRRRSDRARDSDSWGGDTDWSLVRRAAGRTDDRDRDVAWAQLVERYRGPVLRSVRRALRDENACEDAADDFFGYLFERRVLPKAEERHGRFRCYVQGVVRRYALHVRRARAGAQHDVDEIEPPPLGPDETFERAEETAWAEAVLDHALDRLRRATRRDAELLCAYYGIGHGSPRTGSELARQLDLTPNALNVALHRARERLHEAVVAELRTLVADAPSLELELDALVARLLEAHPGLVPGARVGKRGAPSRAG